MQAPRPNPGKATPQAAARPAVLALAGDTMLGRGVAEQLSSGVPPRTLVDEDLSALMRGADACLLNLECCISTRGRRWSAPGKPFFFRAPPRAVELLVHLGVDCVTLANNHALDYGEDALLDTLHHLGSAGIGTIGAGVDEEAARRPVSLQVGGLTVAVLAFTDHPSDFAAGSGRPGVAFANLSRGVPSWLTGAVGALAPGVDGVLVTPHWGPNMVSSPRTSVRRAASGMVAAGASVVAGHSAHVFHGVVASAGRSGRRPSAVLYDLGDFLDDYAVHPELRNDLGLLFLLSLTPEGPLRLEGVPLHLGHCVTRLASGEDAAWVRERFRTACEALGTPVEERQGRVVVTFED